ncbi:MAG: acyltransferase [Limnohabitans sp.]|nr:acyltransferase [Limnohabitans sp.]
MAAKHDTIRDIRTGDRAGFARRWWLRVARLARLPLHRWRLARFGSKSRMDFPAFIVGGRSIEIGHDVRIGRGARFEAHFTAPGVVRLRIGDQTRVAPHVHIGAAERVEIGRECGIGSYTWITDHDHDTTDPMHSVVTHQRIVVAPTIIGDRVYIGERVAILRGVTIGEGSVIGTNSVVTTDIPPYSIAAGVPARVLRQFDRATGEWRAVPRGE